MFKNMAPKKIKLVTPRLRVCFSTRVLEYKVYVVHGGVCTRVIECAIVVPYECEGGRGGDRRRGMC